MPTLLASSRVPEITCVAKGAGLNPLVLHFSCWHSEARHGDPGHEEREEKPARNTTVLRSLSAKNKLNAGTGKLTEKRRFQEPEAELVLQVRLGFLTRDCSAWFQDGSVPLRTAPRSQYFLYCQ